MTAERVCQNKTRFMQMTGDAFFDWNTSSLNVPQKGSISVHGFHPELLQDDWKDYKGEIPTTGPYQFTIDRFYNCIDLETAEIPELPF